ncbi:MAG: TetR/AcrR family transcriptional regulator [Candidatus Hydrogenedentes bacterium]|nr:TetR/AcrR family transcriptional regulator [Candidatus Hydrogenedentota bacterium]
MARPSCKEALLDAAEAVVLESGGARVTLDAVAEKAGVSKGGLLYHFPSKEALLEAMVIRHIGRGLDQRRSIAAELPPTSDRELRAEILLLKLRESQDRFSAALLAAVANEPRLMRSVREFQMHRFHAHEGPEFNKRALLLLAADGLFLMELLQASPFTREQREALVEEMLRQVDGQASAKG